MDYGYSYDYEYGSKSTSLKKQSRTTTEQLYGTYRTYEYYRPTGSYDFNMCTVAAARGTCLPNKRCDEGASRNQYVLHILVYELFTDELMNW